MPRQDKNTGSPCMNETDFSSTLPQNTNNLTPKREKRYRFSHAQKLEICLEYRKPGTKTSQKEMAAWIQRKYNLPSRPSSSTVSDIIRSYEKLTQIPKATMNRKSSMPAKFPELEELLVKRIDEFEKENGYINSQSLKAYAKRLIQQIPGLVGDKPAPTFSNGWFDRFVARHDLQSRRKSEEADSVDAKSQQLQINMPDSSEEEIGQVPRHVRDSLAYKGALQFLDNFTAENEFEVQFSQDVLKIAKKLKQRIDAEKDKSD